MESNKNCEWNESVISIECFFKLTFFIFLLFPSQAHSQISDLKFQKPPKGLPSNRVSEIIQDSNGFMWFGTMRGLSRFDGIGYKNYLKSVDDSTSLRDDNISALYALDSGNILVGTQKGNVYFYDVSKDGFKSINLLDFVEKGFDMSHAGAIFCFLKDSKKRIWVSTPLGLFCFDNDLNFIRSWITPRFTTHPSGLIWSHYNSLFEDSRHRIWMASSEGLTYYDDNKEEFITYTTSNSSLPANDIRHMFYNKKKNQVWVSFLESGIALLDLNADNDPVLLKYYHAESEDQALRLKNNYVKFMMEDTQGRLWVHQNKNGIYVIDLKTDQGQYYLSSKKANSVSNNIFWAIYEDANQTIWLGTHNQGLDFTRKYTDKFEQYKSELENTNSLTGDAIRAFHEDEKGNLWIGSVGQSGGLNYFDRQKNEFTLYSTKSTSPWTMSGNSIQVIREDDEGNLWVPTWNGGLNKITKNGITHYNTENTILDKNAIPFLSKRNDGTFWLGSFGDGLYLFDPVSTHLIKVEFPYYSSFNNIHEDSKGRVWVCSHHGLLKLEYTDSLILSKHTNYSKDSLAGMEGIIPYTLFEDSKKNIWIGSDVGLHQYSESENKFTLFTTKDGLPSNDIQGIIEDDDGNLWLTTLINGIAKFNIKTHKVELFDEGDGLTSNQFIKNGVYKTKLGELIFGSSNGFNIYDKKKHKTNLYIPPVHIIDFKLFNKKVKYGKNSPLKTNIETAEEIVLSYKQHTFSFDFIGLNFIHPEKNQYAYKLEGFNEDWVEVGNNRTASFTNIAPGEYTFRVKASNNDGAWNETGAAIKVIVIPPWWETWWARSLAVILVVTGAVSFYKYRTYKLKKNNEILEKQVEERTFEIKQKQEEILTQNEELRQTQEELETQRDYIEQKNKQLQFSNTQIEHSIVAAKSIQDAFLPPEQLFANNFEEYFLLFRPRDIVSGDFYWASQQGNALWIVVADCTGHGVPGAFMTLLGKNLLDKLVKLEKLQSPAEVLGKLDKEIRETLRQEETGNSQGMDAVALLVKEGTNGSVDVQYAGAKNPLYVIEDNDMEIQTHEADRASIGGASTRKIQFTNHSLVLHKGARLYLSSDGFQDQNNVQRRRFGSKKLKSLLISTSERPLRQQKEVLSEELDTYMKDTSQRDDILVLGLKL